MSKQASKFSVLNHFLVPKHEIVPDSEVGSILKKLNVDSVNKLPKINANDPVVKALGAKRGDIIQITRKDPTGEYMYYRTVV